MNQIERIKKAEEKLTLSANAVRKLDAALSAYSAALGDIRDLAFYLASDEWKADFDAAEKGLLPKDLKCGVLSQDGIYNLLEDNGAVQAKLAEALVKIVKMNKL